MSNMKKVAHSMRPHMPTPGTTEGNQGFVDNGEFDALEFCLSSVLAEISFAFDP